jgi:hypothetical protein
MKPNDNESGAGYRKKKVKMNPHSLRSVDDLKRSFFKEAILNNWTCDELVGIFEKCRQKSYEFEDLLSVLNPYIDTEHSPEEYKEPAALPSGILNECDFLSSNSDFYMFQYSLTEDYGAKSGLIFDEDNHPDEKKGH